MISVRLFARASQLAGVGETQVELESGATVADLKHCLVQSHPDLSVVMPTLFVAVNAEYADDAHVIPEAAEVACFPPVSGG